MTVQKIFPRVSVVEPSAGPAAMTTSQIDEALRDFVLQDTAHLRRAAEDETQGKAHREPESAAQVIMDVNLLVQRVADASLDQVDDAIVDLRNLRDYMYNEGERVQREISRFLQLNQAAIGSAKLITDNIGRWKQTAVGETEPSEKARPETELTDATATPHPLPPAS